MEDKNAIIHEQWSSRWVFVLSATVSAVGLGNIWKSPYITANHWSDYTLFIKNFLRSYRLPNSEHHVATGRITRCCICWLDNEA